MKAVVPTVLQLLTGAFTKAWAVWEDCHGIVLSPAGSRMGGSKQSNMPVEHSSQRKVSMASA